MDGGFRWLAGLLATLVVPIGVEALGWSDPWPVVFAAALTGALCLWNLNQAYARWVNDRDDWEVGSWLSYNLTLALLGIAVVATAALLMRWASTENLQIGVAHALGLWLAGTLPVVQVVRAKLVDITGTASAIPWVVAWGLNALLVAGATVLPAGLLGGWQQSGLLIGFVGFAIWFAFEVARRLIVDRSWLVGVGAFLMLLPVAFVLFAEADRVRWWLLLFFPIGLALVSAQQRTWMVAASLRPRGEGESRSEAWKITTLVGLVLLAVGFAWWVAVIGDDVSRTLVFAGVVGSLFFGASLVTRGEGLVVLVLVGLLMVWVVQDHTGERAPVPDESAQNVLAAFGDSYLSGEGIGSFYADTNTAGRQDLLIGGINECRRSELAYSPLVAADREMELAFYGCSGALATTADFTEDRSDREYAANSVYGQLLRWEDERGAENEPELVLLSLGGNDAGFATIGAACFLPGSCDNALDAGRTPALEGVTTRVGRALRKARGLFPTSPMVVVAYPQMFGPDAADCAGQVPFNGTETRALSSFVDALNAAVGEAVVGVDDERIVHFTGAAAAYEGERFCELDPDGGLVEPAAIRALALQPTEGDDLFDRLVPAKIIHNTFHPTRRGHELMAATLLEFLDEGCHLSSDADSSGYCTAATAPVRPVTATPPADPATSGESEPVGGEVVDDAPVGGCNDLDSFNQCTIIQSLRLVLVPLVLMVLAGLLLALAAWQGDLLRRTARRLPVVGAALRATPLRTEV
jgi:hypothetical protein